MTSVVWLAGGRGALLIGETQRGQSSGATLKLSNGKHDRHCFVKYLIHLDFVVSAQNGAEFLVSHRGNRQRFLALEIGNQSLAKVVDIGRVIPVVKNVSPAKLVLLRPRYPVEYVLSLLPNRLVIVSFPDFLCVTFSFAFRKRLFQPPQRLINRFGLVSALAHKRKNYLSDI